MAINKNKVKRGTVYRARVVLKNGRRISRNFPRRVDAEDWEAKVKAQRHDASLNKKLKMRFDELAALFINNHAKSGLAYSSYLKYENAIRIYIVPEFERCWIDEISKLQVVEFKSSLERKEISASLRNFIFTAFNTVMRKALEWDLLDKNPADGLKPPRRGMSRTEYWTASEAKQFLEYNQNSPHLPLYLIALNTGMRVGEILGLKWDCVDFENGLISVQRIFCQKIKAIKETTKTQRSRKIGINATLHSVLLGLKQNSQSDFVFDPAEFNMKKVSIVSKILLRDCERAKVKVIKFHDLRHTFATQFVMNSGSIHALSGMLGHTTTSMTSRYAHYGPEHAKKAAQVVSFDVPTPSGVLHFDRQKRKISDRSGPNLARET